MAIEADDWRLTGQARYLKGVPLARRAFVAQPNDDHDHCEFCWAKFSNDERISERETSGYVTADGKRWICGTCFHDFAAMFEWVVTEDDAG